MADDASVPPLLPESGHSGDQAGGGGNTNNANGDCHLPLANISRIMQKAVPENGRISLGAKELVQECCSVFIGIITTEAVDKVNREKRKTINGDDLLWVMEYLGFEDYIQPLSLYLQKYREAEG